MKKKAHSLSLEHLEDRCVPAVWGNPWAEPGRLTLSFAPDGTNIDGAPNKLQQALNTNLSESVWQAEILRAFQTWASVAPINLSVVSDNGKPFGEVGPIQGNHMYGDIRIGARSLSSNELAISTPFDLFGNWSGDVLLNTQHLFNRGGGTGVYDLQTALLHEAGHVFGLDNSPDPNSAMYTFYHGLRTDLHPSDVTALQALYGPRQHDRFDLGQNNDTLATAKKLTFVYDDTQLSGTDGTSGSIPFVAAGDLTTLTDRDTYFFQMPNDLHDFKVSLRTSKISLMTARLKVMNSNGIQIASAVASNPTSGDLSVFVGNVTPGATYYIQVEGAQDDVFGIGSYRLAVGKEAQEATAGPPPTAFLNADAHTNDALTSATSLGDTVAGIDARWDVTQQASISDWTDKDFYHIHTHSSAAGTLIATVWAMEVGKLDPVIRVYDANRQPLAAEVVANDASSYTIQVRNVAMNSSYYIEIAATDPLSSYKEGNYFLGVNLRATPIELNTWANGTLTNSNRQATTTLTTTRTQLFHFRLSATSQQSSVESAVRMTIVNSQGQVVYTLVALAGQTVSCDLLLVAGNYRVHFAARAKDPNQSMPNLAFALSGLVRSDPIDPYIIDPTETLPPPPPPNWGQISYFESLFALTDPYSNPYWF